ncbi:MAG: response regulator [Brevibacterium aurantiacum]|uniref:DNA-binding response regulator n=1 Tax=Brevibacterium aurantiacum TaxID=273384 RepID=A0A2A3ZCQ5_BREAU|nr:MULTISPECIES: response regulator transcription factor [Brevibacterium]MDN5735626.1 response regulator transcription factor [Brevibacterium aurantiacum]MDN5737667.1 response regulator transcription factor [Brevibacterium aurantiacum]MDN5772533.1 response regulator transcription factor [Brevibacterium aurantiacum]PCC49241.1 DNA-binding response regulator [Brevibacterium aurantiacum]WCE41985.1 response regulator transcription factor [Brevibacterium sp. BDJS002]
MVITVALVDDQEMVRMGFSLILDADESITVVGQASDGVDAIALAKRERPDVILLDIRMPKLDGLAALPRLTPISKVIMVTTFDDDDYVDAALAGGASGFLLKDAGPDLLLAAVRAAANGDALISPSLTLDLLSRRAQDTRTGEDRLAGLSERENDVARLVARGRTNQEICAELYISLGTVKSHLGSIQTRLGARNRVEIAARMWESGAMNSGR